MSRAASEKNIREAARRLRQLPTDVKNRALENLAKMVGRREADILKANSEDLGRLPGDTPMAFRDRLTLNKPRIQGMIESLQYVAKLPDPVNEVVEQSTLKNGLRVKKVRAPFGVIFFIFESRPNVILEAFSLAFKSGNAVILRGGSESRSSAHCIYTLMRESLLESGVETLPFWPIEDYDRSIVNELLTRKDLIDITIPRGGEALIEHVQKTAQMPIIKNDRGLCHAYVAEDADLEMAVAIVKNGKTQRPGVCNALETVLVHEDIATKFLPLIYKATTEVNLEWRADAASQRALGVTECVKLAKEADWNTEYLDYILNCRLVRDLDEALAHIERYGSKHSETIITRDARKAQKFQMEVDAAAVYWNASTRFTDGYELGLGGEIGVSTQKLHVRGPVGLRELTSPRWLIEGEGQIRT